MPAECVFLSLSSGLYWTNMTWAELHDAALSRCPVSTVNYMLPLPCKTPCSHSCASKWMKETSDPCFLFPSIRMKKKKNDEFLCQMHTRMKNDFESFYARAVFHVSSLKKNYYCSPATVRTETVFIACQQKRTDFNSRACCLHMWPNTFCSNFLVAILLILWPNCMRPVLLVIVLICVIPYVHKLVPGQSTWYCILPCVNNFDDFILSVSLMVQTPVNLDCTC